MMDNQTIARWLTDYAHYLETVPENLFRIRAYRRGAQAVLGLPRPAAEILNREGRRGLARLPGIGSHLAFTIDELVRTGTLRTWKDRQVEPAIDAHPRDRHAESNELAVSE
jgi:DNA polymerase/3'-5' exonuclease PolX